MGNILSEANGLRNWIIHRYNKLNDAEAYNEIEKLIDPIEDFVGVVKKWI
jgi:uncharacterized protein YutE (UPF0331/DUF86 family)